MAAVLVIAFFGCSGGGSSGEGQVFYSFPNNTVLAEYGLAGLTPPVGCTFAWGTRDDNGFLCLTWRGSSNSKTKAYSLIVQDVLGGASPDHTYDDSDDFICGWDMGSYYISLFFTKYDDPANGLVAGEMRLVRDIP